LEILSDPNKPPFSYFLAYPNSVSFLSGFVDDANMEFFWASFPVENIFGFTEIPNNPFVSVCDGLGF
jgi:hypothetical protein